MKITSLIIAGILGTALASQGSTIVYNLGTAGVDGGVLNAATHTWTESVIGFNGTDASFNLVVTAVASGGNWNDDDFANGMAITGGSLDTRVDAAGENGLFSVAIASFNSGTSGYVEANVDFGFTEILLGGAAGTTDSGTFSLLNGAAPSSTLTWVEADAGSDFTGDNVDGSFNLQLVNDTYGTGDRLTSLSHDWAAEANNAWRYNNIEVEYAFLASVPEPSSLALLGMGGMLIWSTRRRKARA